MKKHIECFTSVVSVKLHFFHVFSEIRGMRINKQFFFELRIKKID